MLQKLMHELVSIPERNREKNLTQDIHVYGDIHINIYANEINIGCSPDEFEEFDREFDKKFDSFNTRNTSATRDYESDYDESVRKSYRKFYRANSL